MNQMQTNKKIQQILLGRRLVLLPVWEELQGDDWRRETVVKGRKAGDQ